MCLTSVTKRLAKPRWMTAYKVYAVKYNKRLKRSTYVKPVYPDGTSISLRHKKQPIESSTSVINRFPDYTLGFHAYKHKKDAFAYRCGDRKETVLKVRLRVHTIGVQLSGISRYSVLVGDRLQVIGLVKE